MQNNLHDEKYNGESQIKFDFKSAYYMVNDLFPLESNNIVKDVIWSWSNQGIVFNMPWGYWNLPGVQG